jgi:4-aminobutyrate aminotransferase-like enzyme/Ser/Thr protein kinase RdoA (MazF antagonist)
MSFTFSPPPAVPRDMIEEHLHRAYGLRGNLLAISAERDQNFRVSGPSGDLLLKVCAADEGFALAEAQVNALAHIAATAPDLPVPRVVPAQSGNLVTALPTERDAHPVILLQWLPGDVLGRDAEKHLAEIGALLARLGKALRGFGHPALLERNLVWDVTRASALLPFTHLLGASWQRRAEALIQSFEHDAKPALRCLRAQPIHGDVHPFNTLLHQDRISGIIDFGDMIHAPLVVDPANTIADCLSASADMDSTFSQVLAAYHAQVPLERDEAALVVPLVKMRLVTSAIIALMRKNAGLALTFSIEELCSDGLSTLEQVEAREQHLTTLCLDLTGHHARTSIPATHVMSRRLAAMGPKPLLFYSKPLHILRGEGVWLHADDGRAYLDCYNNVAHVGHAHPTVADAVARQLHTLNTNTRYLTDEAIRYAEELKATLHPSLDTVIFVNSGSEANDVAWRMAQAFAGHRGALCMEFAYHGITDAIAGFSSSNYPEGKWNFPHIRQIEAPDVYRGRYRADHPEPGENYAALADAAIADLKDAGFGVAYAIVDSAFMTNGILDAPAGYVQAVVQRVHQAGGLFVADEVQSGFGRLGSHMWGHQRHGVTPDFVTIGKPAGNGYPIGAVITRAEILARFVTETGPFFSTFGGGNAACAAGLAVLDIMRREGLMQNAARVGAEFANNLRKLMQRHEIIGDVRGMGLAVGVELVTERRGRTPARAQTRRMLDLMREEGVLIGSDGKHGNVLKLRPPLVFSHDNATQVVAALDRAFSRL